jgi:imidazolonepropionase
MNFACIFLRFTPEEALRGVTLHAAHALVLEGRLLSSLDIGKEADLTFWNIETPAKLAYYLDGRGCTGLVKRGEAVV